MRMNGGNKKERENCHGNSTLNDNEPIVKRQKTDIGSKFPMIYSLSNGGNVMVRERGKAPCADFIEELKLLQQMLAKLDAEQFKSVEGEFGFACKLIENHHFTRSTDQLTRSIVACIAVDLLHLAQGKCAHFGKDSVGKILEFAITELKGLRETESAAFTWSFYLLESLATRGQLLLLFKLNPERCDNVMFKTFSTVLDSIKDGHSATVLAYCRDVLEQLLKECPCVTENLIELLLERMMVGYGCKVSQDVLKQILNNCAGKVEQYIAQFYGSSIENYRNKGRELDRIFLNIFKLFCLAPECTVSIWSMLAEECQNSDESIRKRAEDCVSKMLSDANEGRALAQRAPYLWKAWIERACDKSAAIRQSWLKNVPSVAQHCNIEDDETILQALAGLSNDSEEKIRLDFFRTLCSLKNIPNSLLGTIFIHLNDKEHSVREAALQCCTKLGWKSEGVCKNLFSSMYTKDRRIKNQFEEYLETVLLGPELNEEKLLWIFSHMEKKELDAFNSLVASKASLYKLVELSIALASQPQVSEAKLHQIASAYLFKFDQLLQDDLENVLKIFIEDLKRLSIASLESFFACLSNSESIKLCSLGQTLSSEKSHLLLTRFHSFLKRINCTFFNSDLVLFLSANYRYHENIPLVLQSLLHNMPYHGKLCLDILIDQFLAEKSVNILKSIKYIIRREQEIFLKRKGELLVALNDKCGNVDSLLHKRANEIDRKSLELLFLLDNEAASNFLSSIKTSMHSYWLIIGIIAKVLPHLLQDQLKNILTSIKGLLGLLSAEDAVYILKIFIFISKENKNVTIFNIFKALAAALIKSIESKRLTERAGEDLSSGQNDKDRNCTISFQINSSVPFIFYTYGKLLSLSPTKPFLLSDFIPAVQNETFSTRKEFILLVRRGIFYGKLNPIFCALLFLTCVEPSESLGAEAKEAIKMASNAFPLIKLLESWVLLLATHPDMQLGVQGAEMQELHKKFIKYFFDFALNKQTVSDAYLIVAKLSKSKFTDAALQTSNQVLSSLCGVATSILLSTAQSNKWIIESNSVKESELLEHENSGIIQSSIEP